MEDLRNPWLIVAVIVLSWSAPIYAGPIWQVDANWSYGFNWAGAGNYSPLGQTFTAEDPYALVGFCIGWDSARSEPVDTWISLYRGEGIGGPLLQTVPTRPLYPGDIWSPAWYVSDFTDIALQPGQVYTAIITAAITTVWEDRVGVLAINEDRYSGGGIVLMGTAYPAAELTFCVLPVSIPAPSAVVLGGIGVGLVNCLRRRRTL